MAKYVDSIELEEWWAGWVESGDKRNWDKTAEMLYMICLGIAKNFRPKTEEEYYNLANEAAAKLFQKIHNGRLKFKPTVKGGSPVFNLVTTTVHRILCSFKNYDKKRKINHSKFVIRTIQEKAPEMLSSIMNAGSDNSHHDHLNSDF